jgi:hypothetical protein
VTNLIARCQIKSCCHTRYLTTVRFRSAIQLPTKNIHDGSLYPFFCRKNGLKACHLRPCSCSYLCWVFVSWRVAQNQAPHLPLVLAPRNLDGLGPGQRRNVTKWRCRLCNHHDLPSDLYFWKWLWFQRLFEAIPPFRLKSIRDFGTSQRAMASSIRRFFASSFSCSEVSDHRCLNKINRTFLRKRCVTTFRHGDKFGEQKFLSALTELIYVSILKKLVCPLTTREKNWPCASQMNLKICSNWVARVQDFEPTHAANACKCLVSMMHSVLYSRPHLASKSDAKRSHDVERSRLPHPCFHWTTNSIQGNDWLIGHLSGWLT